MDRVIRRSSSLSEGAKCALVSMDSTIRSNLAVGLPLDLVIVKRDRYAVARHLSIDSDDELLPQSPQDLMERSAPRGLRPPAGTRLAAEPAALSRAGIQRITA